MVKRFAVSVVVAVGLLVFNLPMPAIGSTASQSPGRVLINAPDTPSYNASMPSRFAGAARKPQAPHITGAPNHVRALSADAARKFAAQGLTLLTNREGEWQFSATLGGTSRLITVVDGVLPSGRQVVGFGTSPVEKSSTAGLFRTTTVNAGVSYILICSYAWMNSYYDDLHLHLCNVDATYLAAIITVVEAAIGTLVGVLIGNVVGGVVGLAVGTGLALLTLGFFWTHSDAWGNVDFVIPSWTMSPPFGGNVLWANVNVWDYMWDQCWINDHGYWYHPQCSY
jgi:hypothetical protein